MRGIVGIVAQTALEALSPTLVAGFLDGLF
jgi:hypothetical protein